MWISKDSLIMSGFCLIPVWISIDAVDYVLILCGLYWLCTHSVWILYWWCLDYMEYLWILCEYWFCIDSIWILSGPNWFCIDSIDSVWMMHWFCMDSVWIMYWFPMVSVQFCIDSVVILYGLRVDSVWLLMILYYLCFSAARIRLDSTVSAIIL